MRVVDALEAVQVGEQQQRLPPGTLRLLEMLRGIGPLCVPVAVLNGRVAVGDVVGAASGAGCVVHLIGERPGLGVADALTYNRCR